jgi:hypothetical protein
MEAASGTQEANAQQHYRISSSSMDDLHHQICDIPFVPRLHVRQLHELRPFFTLFSLLVVLACLLHLFLVVQTDLVIVAVHGKVELEWVDEWLETKNDHGLLESL